VDTVGGTSSTFTSTLPASISPEVTAAMPGIAFTFALTVCTNVELACSLEKINETVTLLAGSMLACTTTEPADRKISTSSGNIPAAASKTTASLIFSANWMAIAGLATSEA